MRKVTINIDTESDFRASEIIADLRNTAELLYHPMKLVGFWDLCTDGHMCPQIQKGNKCTHREKSREQALKEYRVIVEQELHGVMEINFPHANIYIYLG